MQEILNRNIVYKISAMLLAVLLWFYVTNVQNPATDKNMQVAVAYNGLEDGLIISEGQESVNIKVKGRRSVITTLVPEDIKAAVDLQEAQVGKKEYRVEISLPLGIELVSIESYSVLLTIDVIQEKQLPIKVKSVNTVAQGYSSFESVLTPSQVVVRGPQKMLADLIKAQVTVDLNQATDNLTLTLPVYLVNSKGEQVANELIETSPQNVQVYVPVIQNIPTKAVAVKSVIVGKPKQNWKVSRVVLEPEIVRITGPYEKLLAIEKVQTQAIDITGKEGSFVAQVPLDAPEGIKLLYEPYVKVIIQMEQEVMSKNFIDISINVQNKEEGKKVVLNPEKVTISVKGSKSEVENLKADNLKALVDVKELELGTHELKISVDISDSLQVMKVQPSTVKVTISEEKLNPKEGAQ